MLDIESYLLGKKAGGGGGGNPNRTETLTGTAADVFSSMDRIEWANLCSAVVVGNASVKLTLDVSALGISGTLLYWLSTNSDATLWGEECHVYDGAIANASELNYGYHDNIPTLLVAYVYSDGSITDFVPYASYVPTTATIYWHPMPSGS